MLQDMKSYSLGVLATPQRSLNEITSAVARSEVAALAASTMLSGVNRTWNTLPSCDPRELHGPNGAFRALGSEVEVMRPHAGVGLTDLHPVEWQ